MTCVAKVSPAGGNGTVRSALTEPLSAGDVYEAKTNSVDMWALNGSKEVGNLSLLGLPSLLRRFTRCKNAQEYAKASLIAVPTVPLAAFVALGGLGSAAFALAAPPPRLGAQRRSDEGVWEERLVRALDLNREILTKLATQLSGTELREQLNQERIVLADVSKCLAEQGKRTRCSGLLKSRLRVWSDQIEQLGCIAKQA